MDFSLNKQTILYILLYIIVFFIIYFLLYIYTYKLLHYFFPDKIEGFKAQAQAQQSQQAQAQQSQAEQSQQAQAQQQAQQSQKNIILLGDSILNNSMYVKKDESIQNLLVNKGGKNKIYYMAKDGAVIADIYEQFSTIPLELDSDQTLFFISVGGNDILNKIKKDNIAKNMTNNLNKIFSAYKKLIKAIQTRFIKSKIVLLDIYLPPSLTKLQNDYITQWNKLLSDYSDNNNSIKNLISISLKLTNKDDFVNGYEPSPTGGKKIVDQIFYNI